MNSQPHDPVFALIHRLVTGVEATLGPDVAGVYLFGSLTAGGFDAASDIDIVVVTQGELSSVQVEALAAMHAALAATDPVWGDQLEVSYIPRAALRRYDPADAVHPRLQRGRDETLRPTVHDVDWVIERYYLREMGVALSGPPPAELVDPVAPDDMREAARETVTVWLGGLLDDPSPLAPRGYQSFVVLTACRALYTLQTGATVSKPAAARWVISATAERWAALVHRALEGRLNPGGPAAVEDIAATLDFIRYALAVASRSG